MRRTSSPYQRRLRQGRCLGADIGTAMTELTVQHDFDVFIHAPVHQAFAYCLDPRGIYADDPSYDVVDASLAEEAVGTSAEVRAGGRALAEEVSLEYVEVVPDSRIVFMAHPRMVIGGWGDGIPMSDHEFIWTFEEERGGTRLSLCIVEHDPPRWLRFLDRIGGKSFERQVHGRLARIKAGVET